MSLYDELGDKYDLMIRWKPRLEREAPFFQRLFSEIRAARILDLGCGTGHHAHLFRNWGLDVTGVDPSPVLLELARGKGDAKLMLDTEDEKLRFVEADFDQFASRVQGPYDAILALGNTLPHIDTLPKLKKLFADVYDLLRPGGVFLLQNRNYDRLLKTRERFLLPTTFREGENEQIFFRFNDFEEERVRFNVVHFTRVGQSWVQNIHSTLLSPWRREQIEEILRETGFGAITLYGDFSGAPFDVDGSQDLIGLARKSDQKS
ncbi:MAG: class I SAM-dependent methyltransferase [bacterium]